MTENPGWLVPAFVLVFPAFRGCFSVNAFGSCPFGSCLSSCPNILQVNLHSSVFLAVAALGSLFAVKTPWLSRSQIQLQRQAQVDTKACPVLWPSNKSITRETPGRGRWEWERRAHLYVNEPNPPSSYRGEATAITTFMKVRNRGARYSQFPAEGRWISGGQLQTFTIFCLSLLWKAALRIFRPQFPELHTQRNLRTGKSQEWLKEINTVLCAQSAASLPTWAISYLIFLRLTQGWFEGSGHTAYQAQKVEPWHRADAAWGQGAGEGRVGRGEASILSVRRPHGSTSSEEAH